MSNTHISKSKKWKIVFFLCIAFVCSTDLLGQSPEDSSHYSRAHFYQLSIKGRSGYVFPTNAFLKGDNFQNKPIESIYSTHLKYSFGFHPDSYVNKIYMSVYQGIGVSHFGFVSKEEVGNPVALY